MVIELYDKNEYNELISKNELIIIGIANKDNKIWKYLETLLKALESQVDFNNIKVVIVDIKVVKDTLQDFEIEIAKRRTLIKVLLNGMCVFIQEDVMENIANDMEILRRGIRDSLKKYSINLRFART
uniref:Uncharacterized protein n=1 Tax=Ignisphaera aggregans TaxID=334771 RepID=A0A7C5XN37_9CREN